MSTDLTSTSDEPKEATVSRNGLGVLRQVGIPDGAITALLVALATLTILPYMAGRDFGPYSFPDVLPSGSFWTLALVTPLCWIVLLLRISPIKQAHWKRILVSVVIAEGVALIVGIGSSTTTDVVYFEDTIPSKDAKYFGITLPAVSRVQQKLDVTLLSIESLESPIANDAGIAISICGASEDGHSEACKFEQTSKGRTRWRYFEKGPIRISVFNYEANPSVHVRLRVEYLRRRFL
jgi:hypothetical protein